MARTGFSRKAKKKIDYNVQTLSDNSVKVPKSPIKKKEKGAPAQVKKAKGAKKGKKTGATYLVLIKRALKGVEAPGWGLKSIVNHIIANYPDKTNRKHIRLALQTGVEKKLFVKTRASWRLSKKAQSNMARSDPKKKKKTTTKKKTTSTKKPTKKTTTKKSSTKKATTKKATTKKTTKKATTKKATTKKASTKKATTKKATTKKAPAKKGRAETTPKVASKKRVAEEEAESPSPKKKVIGPPASDESGSVSEAIGKWQYYDGGWRDYEENASRIVEGVYQEYQFEKDIHIRPVQSGHFSYSVNFKTLEQTNTSTGTMRKIRRI